MQKNAKAAPAMIAPFTAHKNTKDNSILLSPKLETNIYSRRFYILRFNEDKLVRGNYFFCDQDVDYMENKIPETFED